MTTRTVACFEITAWDPLPADAETPGIGRATVRKRFTGPLTGTSVAHLQTAEGEDGGRGYVATELVTGELDGRVGSFVLQHGGIDTGDGPPSTFGHVVAGTATGALAGLTGTATYVHDGERAELHLDVTLP